MSFGTSLSHITYSSVQCHITVSSHDTPTLTIMYRLNSVDTRHSVVNNS